VKLENPQQTITSSRALTCAISCDPTLNPYVFFGVGAWICDVSVTTTAFYNTQVETTGRRKLFKLSQTLVLSKQYNVNQMNTQKHRTENKRRHHKGTPI